MRTYAAIALIFFSSLAVAEAPGGAKTEIDHLLSYVASSGCEFNRNGCWHDAAAAKNHILQKYDFLVDRGSVSTAESFIEHAASKSSVSGKPYLVKCPGGQPLETGTWLRTELSRYRKSAN
jgi:hypothetical protein